MHTYATTGSYDVTLSLPNEADCAANDIFSYTFTIDVIEEASLVAAFDFSYDQCDNNGVISFTDQSVSTNQGNIIAWDWDFSTGETSSDQNTSINVGGNQTITVSLTITTDANCTTSVVEEIPLVLIDTQVDIMDQLSCIDKEVGLNPNPNLDYAYEWSPTAGLSDPNSPNPTVIASTNTVYTVTITDESQGCTSVQMMTLTVPQQINLDVPDDEVGCEDLQVELEASADVSVTYTWTLDGAEVGTNSAIDAVTGRPNIYTVVAIDEFGCEETDQVEVSNYEVISALGANEEVLCLGDVLGLEITNGLSGSDVLDIVWNGTDIDVTDPSAPVVNPSESTVYTATITNQFGCSTVETVLVEVIDIDQDVFGVLADPDTIFLGNSTQLSLTVADFDGLTYTWNNSGSLNDDSILGPLATPQVTTEYTVLVEDENGCLTERTVTVVVNDRACDEPFIYFPNAFSPNNDGENDMLRLRAKDDFIDEAYWIVYNRWGEKVFEANSLNEMWDGMYNGELVAPDAYGYYLRVDCSDGNVFEKKGNVTVLR